MNSMVIERGIPFYIVLSACLLVTLGDLRNVITPLGYWALWGVVFLVGVTTGGLSKVFKDLTFLSATVGFALLIFALLLVSIVNFEPYTAYQALKILLIYALLIVLCVNCSHLKIEHLYDIAAISTVMGFTVFVLCKYIFTEYYIQLGDGRQGSVFAYPGVLWKTNAFFVSFLIAKLLSGVTYKNLVPASLILVSVFLLLADSSRTGFLWFAIIIAAYSSLMFVVNTAKFLSSIAVILFCAGLLAMFNLDIIYSFFDNNSLLVINRLFEGDPIRSKMIIDGVLNAERCLPIGCGFQTSTSLVNGLPMVIHNVYLAILGDLGIFGEIGLLIIVITPPLLFSMREWFGGATLKATSYYKLAAILGAACYCFVLLFHPLSSEMSEWGYWAIMLSWLSRLGRESAYTDSAPVSVAQANN
ncbi:hypothetical protein J3P91_19075 [Pseudomonas sp. Z4-7]|uniref:hypothetical protein n=1 Tax=Pseudomonas sp. Z4-7 TaxID=2817413 RepID=UPI003DA860EC